jgi:hypothetical protein
MLQFKVIYQLSSPRVFDLTVPRPPHSSPVLRALANLKPGGQYRHDHSGYKTPISVWVAQNRNRLGKRFQYRKMKEHGQFVITLPSISANA